MQNKVFFNFLYLLLIKHKSKHITIFIISILIVFFISSVLFISNSLKKEIFSTLQNQSDFIIQKTNSGKTLDTPLSWIEDFSSINIIDFDEREQVLEYIGKIPPDSLAEIAYRWGILYKCFSCLIITMEYTIKFTDREIETLALILQEAPYKKVKPLLDKMGQQIDEQNETLTTKKD